MPNLDASLSGNALLERYRNERRVEMAAEELRFDDVRRWKIGPQTIGQPAMGVNINLVNGVPVYDYSLVTDNDRRWLDKMYLLPIPYSEIIASHGTLTPNPGY